MAQKWKVERIIMKFDASGKVTSARTDFKMRETSAKGKLAEGVEESVVFTPTFPITEQSIVQDVEKEIVKERPGSSKE